METKHSRIKYKTCIRELDQLLITSWQNASLKTINHTAFNSVLFVCLFGFVSPANVFRCQSFPQTLEEPMASCLVPARPNVGAAPFISRAQQVTDAPRATRR